MWHGPGPLALGYITEFCGSWLGLGYVGKYQVPSPGSWPHPIPNGLCYAGLLRMPPGIFMVGKGQCQSLLHRTDLPCLCFSGKDTLVTLMPSGRSHWLNNRMGLAWLTHRSLWNLQKAGHSGSYHSFLWPVVTMSTRLVPGHITPCVQST